MTDIAYNRSFECDYGYVEQVTPDIRRIVARNASPFTFKGTGTYIIGRGKVAVIDAGPDIPEHIEALLAALVEEEITHQLITHTHLDHSPASRAVKAATGAETYAYGPHGSGKFEQGVEVEEGGDREFVPDNLVRDGDIIDGEGWSFECVYTPGHTSNHVCFAYREAAALFSGDHVMGWSTTVVSPPDGDMADYRASLKRLLDRDDRLYYPTHGAPIEAPQAYVASLIDHRQDREDQILECLKRNIRSVPEMVPEMYKDLNPALIPAARRSVFAHVIDLSDRGVIEAPSNLSAESTLKLASPLA